MILLDTHVWVWWVSRAVALPRKVVALIDRRVDEGAVYVSSISTWEVALLVQRGRLELSMGVADWVAKSEALPFLRFVPVDRCHCRPGCAIIRFRELEGSP